MPSASLEWVTRVLPSVVAPGVAKNVEHGEADQMVGRKRKLWYVCCEGMHGGSKLNEVVGICKGGWEKCYMYG